MKCYLHPYLRYILDSCSVPWSVDNSDSPSIVKQSQQGANCSCIPFIIHFSGSVEYPMPYASCLVSCSVVWRCPCSSAYPIVLCLMQLCLSEDLGLYSPFYLGCFSLHPGIACLGYLHYGIACLASQASNLVGAS